MQPNVLLFKSYFIIFPLLSIAKPIHNGKALTSKKHGNKLNQHITKHDFKTSFVKQEISKPKDQDINSHRKHSKLPNEIINNENNKDSDDDEDAKAISLAQTLFGNNHVPKRNNSHTANSIFHTTTSTADLSSLSTINPATVNSTVNTTSVISSVNDSTIDVLMQKLLDNAFVQKMMGHRSKDAVWAALCLGFILCLLVLALLCSKPWRDPYQQSWLHDRPDFRKEDNVTVAEVLKSKRKYLPKVSLKKKKMKPKKKKQISQELIQLLGSDTDSEELFSI